MLDVAKRSPILGYNHNVRYRGLVFHVQTEDSGLMSPHLFTHLFHGGVIISTRKLVYDAGAAEEAIKSLMQAQHKAVLKDLKKGSFDDKIDQYLGATEGLLPRGASDDADARTSEPALATPPAGTPVPKPPIVPDTAPTASLEPPTSRLPTEHDASSPDLSELAPPGSVAAKVARTKTADRGSAPSQVRTNLPPPPPSLEELGGPTLDDHEAASIAAAVAAANATGPNRMQSASDAATVPVHMPPEMSPLEIELELDEPEELPQRARPRDTDIATPADVATKRPGEPAQPPPLPPNAHPRASSSVGAAALPPKPPTAKLPARPSMTPQQVISRPIAPRDADSSGAVEVYAPAPPSAELPTAGGERPGQYAQHKRVSQKIDVIKDVAKDAKERPGSGSNPAVPAGLGRPGRVSSSPSSGVPKPIGRDAPSGSNAVPAATSSSKPGGQTRPFGAKDTGGAPVVQHAARDQSSGTRTRTPTPSRLAAASAPSPSPSRTASSSGGVVMTRPAVIVGAPAKPAQPQRVRKAREDEGRGFGQGLISEKSLDEVILAYLSEDADEK